MYNKCTISPLSSSLQPRTELHELYSLACLHVDSDHAFSRINMPTYPIASRSDVYIGSQHTAIRPCDILGMHIHPARCILSASFTRLILLFKYSDVKFGRFVLWPLAPKHVPRLLQHLDSLSALNSADVSDVSSYPSQVNNYDY